MKKLFILLLILVSAATILFVGCQKDISEATIQQTAQKVEPFTFSQNEAVAYFNEKYQLASSASQDVFSPITHLAPTATWEHALRGRVGNIEFYEVPLKSSLGELGARQKADNTPSKKELWNLNRLIVFKRPNGGSYNFWF